AKLRHQLGLVGQYDETVGRGFDDLLTQQRTAQPFDQVQRRVDLVGAVEREIEPRALVQRRDLHPKLASQRSDRIRCRHADDIAQPAILQRLRQSPQHVCGRRAGAQAKRHTALDILKRMLGGLALVAFEIDHLLTPGEGSYFTGPTRWRGLGRPGALWASPQDLLFMSHPEFYTRIFWHCDAAGLISLPTQFSNLLLAGGRWGRCAAPATTSEHFILWLRGRGNALRRIPTPAQPPC